MSQFPESISIDEKEYPILTNFRAVFLWHERIARNKLLAPQEMAWATVNLFMYEIPRDWTGAYEEICKFIACGKEPEEGEETFSFTQDYFPIYSAFREKGIDIEKEDLHWWAFRAVLDDLPEDCLFRRIIEIRTATLKMPTSANPEDWERFHKMSELKEKYRLKEG